MIRLARHSRGVILPVQARAGARSNAIRGEHDGSLKVAVTQVAEKGKANRAIIKLLSKALGIPRSTIELISGTTSASKQFLLHDTTASQVQQQLEPFVKLTDQDQQ